MNPSAIKTSHNCFSCSWVALWSPLHSGKRSPSQSHATGTFGLSFVNITLDALQQINRINRSVSSWQLTASKTPPSTSSSQVSRTAFSQNYLLNTPKHRGTRVRAKASLLQGLALPLTTRYPGHRESYPSPRAWSSNWVIEERFEDNDQHLHLILRTSLLLRLGVLESASVLCCVPRGSSSSRRPSCVQPGACHHPMHPVTSLHHEEVTGGLVAERLSSC